MKLTRQERQLAALKRYIDRQVYLSERQYLAWLEANHPRAYQIGEQAALDHVARRTVLSEAEDRQ